VGHLRLDRLPRTRRWKEVIRLLQQGAPVDELAQATYWAAYNGLSRVPADEGFTQTLTTIFKFIDALQSRNPDLALRQNGFDLKEGASFFDYIGSFKERASIAASAIHAKSDIAEIAQDSFTQVLVSTASSGMETLFGIDSGDIKTALQGNLKGKSLENIMHEFFVSFTQRYLNYYLGRELPSHVGINESFSNIDRHSQFNQAFDLYIRQTVRITDEFAPGWFGKARYEKRLTDKDVARFAHVAFMKIRSEFKRGAEANE
jgi:hypothetical protein